VRDLGIAIALSVVEGRAEMPKRVVALLTSLGIALGCGPRVMTPYLREPSTLPPSHRRSLPLKVHLRSGELLYLASWRVLPDGKTLEGEGTRYTILREAKESGLVAVPMEEIAVIEATNKEVVSSLELGVLTGLTVVFGVVSGICLSDPKSCFGSCPTFYAEEDPERPKAEGFSASVARVLEARDVDLLSGVRARDGRLRLWMRNEALETHAVRRIRLLTVPRPQGGRVVPTREGAFHSVRRLSAPVSCRGPEGDCTREMARADGLERRSLADGEDLAAREELRLTFPVAPTRAGLVVRARQSLLSTFLFYQTLAYMGRSAGDWLAELERSGPERARSMLGMGRVLGGIEVLVAGKDGVWATVGSFDEAGPIAGDTQVIPLPERPSVGPLHVRLRMARGHWRLDEVALGELGPAVSPSVFDPVGLERGGRPDAGALRTLLDPDSHLVTLPGDAVRLSFRLPPEAEGNELFLESEGYYYEWMRADWMREEDPAMVSLILNRPGEALRRLAAPFKAQEAFGERTFWSSRFGRSS
jgi:hypothetical protein